MMKSERKIVEKALLFGKIGDLRVNVGKKGEKWELKGVNNSKNTHIHIKMHEKWGLCGKEMV